MLNRVWNGGDGAWTTVAGYVGKALPEDVEVAKNFRAEEIAVLDTDNNGHVDAIDVLFSEAIDPATLENAAWTLAGYGALTATADAENAAHVRFTFAEGEAYDTAATPALTIDSAITDLAGNAVTAGQGLALSDNAAPVLVYAKAEGGKIADDTMPEGVTVTLTFSEPVKQYLFTAEDSTVDQIMSNFQIRRNNPNQRYLRKIKSFCYHLRSDKDPRAAAPEFFQDFTVAVLCAGCVIIHAHRRYTGKKRRSALLKTWRKKCAE